LVRTSRVLPKLHDVAVVDQLISDLRKQAASLREMAALGHSEEISEPLRQLEHQANRVGKAWSGSNLGYHSQVYYSDLKPPPPGAHFDREWGLMDMEMSFHGSTGHWQEYEADRVIGLIEAQAAISDMSAIEKAGADAHALWVEARGEVTSVLSAFVAHSPDSLIESLRDELAMVQDLVGGGVAVAAVVGPQPSMITRDTTALSQGWIAAPHQRVIARVVAPRSAFGACEAVASIAERGAAHIERVAQSRASVGQSEAVRGDRIFIGHGRSNMWRDLKDFMQDRLQLPWDEFNRVPVAGVTNIARLSEMLDQSGIAFLVLTSEDETLDGQERARQNVVHEAGLFQGRLGFSRAIVMLEEGCEEFSNIQGLGQIRFPRGDVSAKFEEVRRVLEREGFLDE
jgi:predicted nucleotide-binding protein